MLPYNLHEVRIDLPPSLGCYLKWQFIDVSAFSVPYYYMYICEFAKPSSLCKLIMAVLQELHSHLLVNRYGSDEKKLVIYIQACL